MKTGEEVAGLPSTSCSFLIFLFLQESFYPKVRTSQKQLGLKGKYIYTISQVLQGNREQLVQHTGSVR